MDYSLYLMWILWLIIGACSQNGHKASQQEVDYENNMKQLFAKDYRHIRPNVTGAPVVVEVGVHFVKIGVSTKQESYETDVFIRMIWNDTRMCHNATDYIVLSGEHKQPIWTPDVYVENALKSNKHEVTKLNNYVRIYPSGKMLISLRATITAKCSQDLFFFPLDTQKCKMILESYSYTKEQLHLKWMKELSTHLARTHLEAPQFVISLKGTEEGFQKYSTGTYSRLVINIELNRHVGFYIIQVYIPCILIVVLSWLTFWISPEEIGDRIALGITCVLTLVFLMNSINDSLPKVSYVKTIDFYIIGCFLYVFTVVLQTVIAKHLSKEEKQEKHTKKSEDSYIISNTPATLAKHTWGLIRGNLETKNMTSIGNDIKMKQETMVKRRKKRDIDWYCRIIYPLVFVILHIIYWFVCVYKAR